MFTNACSSRKVSQILRIDICRYEHVAVVLVGRIHAAVFRTFLKLQVREMVQCQEHNAAGVIDIELETSVIHIKTHIPARNKTPLGWIAPCHTYAMTLLVRSGW